LLSRLDYSIESKAAKYFLSELHSAKNGSASRNVAPHGSQGAKQAARRLDPPCLKPYWEYAFNFRIGPANPHYSTRHPFSQHRPGFKTRRFGREGIPARRRHVKNTRSLIKKAGVPPV